MVAKSKTPMESLLCLYAVIRCAEDIEKPGSGYELEMSSAFKKRFEKAAQAFDIGSRRADRMLRRFLDGLKEIHG